MGGDGWIIILFQEAELSTQNGRGGGEKRGSGKIPRSMYVSLLFSPFLFCIRGVIAISGAGFL